MNSSNPGVQQAVSDGKDLAHKVLSAIKTGCDAVAGALDAKVEPLTADALPVAEAFIENLAPARLRPYLASVLGLAGGMAGSALGPVDASVHALIHLAQANADAAIDHLDARFS